ncbi:MAG TPA: hypothetical protein VMF13_20260 [Luteitalea sp.]|nr:hypothetical protein [Luteitalea sp.]
MPPTRPSFAAVLLLGVALATSSLASAQQPAATRTAADLDRIRRQFVEQSNESVFLGPVRADYSVRVQEEKEDLDYHFGYLYDQSTATPGYVRPWYPIYHYELQSIMIPPEHRAQLYPIGVPTGNVVGAIKNAFGGASRKRKEREAKAQVEAELKAIREKPPQP